MIIIGMFDKEKHKNDFFKFIVENENELKRALKKNITMDEDLFDDVTCSTIVRIAEYIMNKGVKVDSFKNLFFMAAKREFIAEQNKKRKRIASSNRDFFTNIFNGLEKREKQEDLNIYRQLLVNDDDERKNDEKYSKMSELLGFIEEKLNEQFLPVEVDIFLIYFILKSNKNGISYKKLAELTDIDLKYITTTIQKVKKFVKNNAEIIEMKNKLMKDDD